jgi:stage V sporulation protein B
MSLATVLMRAIAVGFNVYLSKKIGAEALGLFSLVSSVYGFAITFSTSGIYLAVTRLVSEEIGKNNPQNVGKIMKRATLYCLIFSSIASFVLFFFW